MHYHLQDTSRANISLSSFPGWKSLLSYHIRWPNAVYTRSVFLFKTKSIEIWHRLVGTCLSYFSQFLPSCLAVGAWGWVVGADSSPAWRRAFSCGLIEGADYDACRSFRQILTWKQCEDNPTAHSPFLPILSASLASSASHRHINNTKHLYGPHTVSQIHTCWCCVHRKKMCRNQLRQSMASNQLLWPNSAQFCTQCYLCVREVD